MGQHIEYNCVMLEEYRKEPPGGEQDRSGGRGYGALSR